MRPAVRVRVEGSSLPRVDRVFTEPFTVGRGMQATLHLDSGRVSRLHAEVVFEDGRWLVQDAGSTNGIYQGDRRVERVPLEGETVVRLGREGPSVYLWVEGDAPSSGAEDRARRPTTPDTNHRLVEGTARPSAEPTRAVAGGKEEGPGSVTEAIRHYFDEREDQAAGTRTMMIRNAFQEVYTKQRSTYSKVVAAVAVLLVGAIGFAIWQQIRVGRLEQTTASLFYDLKQQDMGIAELRLLAAEEGNADLAARLDGLEDRRRQTAARYAGYVEELGLHRKLTPEEREIYRVARIFNESEFAIPAGFVDEVKGVIAEWQQTDRFEEAIRLAEARGYTQPIVETFVEYGLPPEFFYLALQESDFDRCAIGPRTRWGIAKGMWQFIPTTARRFGLVPGPRAEQRVPDPDDERCDVAKATDAAARYLLTIYTELAEASGLLVMASYNWGEHRVGPRLDALTPLEIVQHDLEGIPANPQARNYWRFLSEHRDRMPDETKDYVLHIFSAAVIGQNPRLFGFDFDNPLERYLETTAASSLAHARP